MAKETHITPADEVEVIATSLINEYHPELKEASIVYCFTTAATKCSPQKPNPALRYFASTHVKGVQKAEVAAGPDFIIWVNDLLWAFQLDRGKQRPFVDHLLEHIAKEVDGEGISRWVLKGHSLEEHAAVLQRFGPWSDEAKQVRDILQPELDLGLSEPERSDRPRRKSSIEAVTLSTNERYPISMSPEEWEAVVRQRTGGEP